MIMVKPALPYLDVIRPVRSASTCRSPPTTSRASTRWSKPPPRRLDRRARVALETLTAIRRAGADLVVTYWTKDRAAGRYAVNDPPLRGRAAPHAGRGQTPGAVVRRGDGEPCSSPAQKARTSRTSKAPTALTASARGARRPRARPPRDGRRDQGRGARRHDLRRADRARGRARRENRRRDGVIESLRLVRSGTEAAITPYGSPQRSRPRTWSSRSRGATTVIWTSCWSRPARGAHPGHPRVPGRPRRGGARTIARRTTTSPSRRGRRAVGDGFAASSSSRSPATSPRLPAERLLELLRALADASGVLLVFDEVVRGFRLALGGAQERFGAGPTSPTLREYVGGGLPVGAYGGRKEIMERAPAGRRCTRRGRSPVTRSPPPPGCRRLRRLRDPAVYDGREVAAPAKL